MSDEAEVAMSGVRYESDGTMYSHDRDDRSRNDFPSGTFYANPNTCYPTPLQPSEAGCDISFHDLDTGHSSRVQHMPSVRPDSSPPPEFGHHVPHMVGMMPIQMSSMASASQPPPTFTHPATAYMPMGGTPYAFYPTQHDDSRRNNGGGGGRSSHGRRRSHSMSSYSSTGGDIGTTVPTAGINYGPGQPIVTSDRLRGEPGCNLFCFHLPNEMTNWDLYLLFRRFGSVLSVHIMINNLTGLSRGFGFISFEEAASAAEAIRQLNGFRLGFKRLKVQYKRGYDPAMDDGDVNGVHVNSKEREIGAQPLLLGEEKGDKGSDCSDGDDDADDAETSGGRGDEAKHTPDDGPNDVYASLTDDHQRLLYGEEIDGKSHGHENEGGEDRIQPRRQSVMPQSPQCVDGLGDIRDAGYAQRDMSEIGRRDMDEHEGQRFMNDEDGSDSSDHADGDDDGEGEVEGEENSEGYMSNRNESLNSLKVNVPSSPSLSSMSLASSQSPASPAIVTMSRDRHGGSGAETRPSLLSCGGSHRTNGISSNCTSSPSHTSSRRSRRSSSSSSNSNSSEGDDGGNGGLRRSSDMHGAASSIRLTDSIAAATGIVVREKLD